MDSISSTIRDWIRAMDSYNSSTHSTRTCNLLSSCCNAFNVDIAASFLRCHSSLFCVVALRFAFLSTNSLWIILLSTPLAATHSCSFAQFSFTNRGNKISIVYVIRFSRIHEAVLSHTMAWVPGSSRFIEYA